MRFSLLQRSLFNCTAVALSFFGALPACSFASSLTTFPYAKTAGIPVEKTSVDIYDCDPSYKYLVVYVHGGAWIRGDKSKVHAMPDFFSENKVCFASINYPLSSPSNRSLMEHQLDALRAFNDWLASAKIRSKSFESISLLGHSAGAHLVALFDKRFGWNGQVDNLILLDSASYDLNLKYTRSSPKFKSLLAHVLRLDTHSPESYSSIFRSFSPALLPPKPRPHSTMNIVLFSGLRFDARESGRLLGESYMPSADHLVRYFNYPWKHSDFPRNIGSHLKFSNQLLKIVKP